MDPETLSALLNSLICLVPICLGMTGFIAAAGLLVWLARRQRQPTEGAPRAGAEPGADGLRPWSPDALTDLSTDWDARWSRLGRRVKARGTIPSVSDPQGPALVAFVLKASGAFEPRGELQARTTAQTFDFRIDREGTHIRVEGRPFDSAQGRPFGHVRPDGTLLDAQGNPIGNAGRPPGRPAIFRAGGVAKLRDERERSYPVTLNGRVVGHLAHPKAQMVNAIPLQERRFPPAVTLEGRPFGQTQGRPFGQTQGRPSDEEATWLLALAIRQIAFYNLLETIWTN